MDISTAIVEYYLENIRGELCKSNNRKVLDEIASANKMNEVLLTIEDIRKSIKTEKDLENWAAKFNWTSDSYSGMNDWSPWIQKLAYDMIKFNQVRDDCDGSARWTHYLYRFLESNTNLRFNLFEFVVTPTPLISGMTKAHALLAVKSGWFMFTRYTIWSNGHKAGVFKSIEEYCKAYAEAKGYKTYIVRMLPRNNYDTYLSNKVFGS
jgi:hypothetical protein